MRTFFVLIGVLMSLALSNATSSAADARCYEMRIYYAAPGKLDALNARFRDHTTALFIKHGMENIGYWMPQDNKDQKLIYVLAYPSREAREKSWKEFMADPDWQSAWKASEVNGKLVAKVETHFMTATDYSPSIAPKSAGPRVFELRTYTATPGKLENLNARFRDHTLALFSRHGMQNIAYWNLSKGEKGADQKLIYILAHQSKEAGEASFKSFRDDPDWKKARTESEEKAGGSLTLPDGVKSEYMQATDYSPMR
ncbi:MAG: NIPSNAP family protein [Verrucomicrobia bacterium]|nr:NIPSNAP family protein [Verrucomicrobiota bacterium]MBI3868087.1 NIPSNAP family protein [Verrucomicrobiota bacterium]